MASRRSRAVVDGVRHVRIWETLKNIVAPQPIYLVYLEAPEELRRARLQERGAQEANYLAKAEAHSTERDVIAELPQLANLVLSTEGKEAADLVRAIKLEFRVRSVGMIAGPVLCLCSIYLRRMAQCGVRENSIARE